MESQDVTVLTHPYGRGGRRGGGLESDDWLGHRSANKCDEPLVEF